MEKRRRAPKMGGGVKKENQLLGSFGGFILSMRCEERGWEERKK